MVSLSLSCLIAAAAPGAPDLLAVGTWRWFNGGRVILKLDHTAIGTDDSPGRWSASPDGRKVEIIWDKGWHDVLALSADGNALDGANKGGTHVWGKRADDAITGTWQWFNNGTVVLYGDGSAIGTDGSPGVWVAKDASARRYQITWAAGWLDTLTLSADGSGLDGSNAGGTHVWGKRVAEPPAAVVATQAAPPPAAGGSTQCDVAGRWTKRYDMKVNGSVDPGATENEIEVSGSPGSQIAAYVGKESRNRSTFEVSCVQAGTRVLTIAQRDGSYRSVIAAVETRDGTFAGAWADTSGNSGDIVLTPPPTGGY
jgi:hypothetical protein